MDIAAHMLKLPPAQIFFILRPVNDDVVSSALAFLHYSQAVKILSADPDPARRSSHRSLFWQPIPDLSALHEHLSYDILDCAAVGIPDHGQKIHEFSEIL